MVVDTACASSFTAMHLACSALWNSECELVVAGGANPVIIPEVTVGYSALGVLSPEGMSCPFSDTAKGYVRSEGWGAFILKPLESALRDNDHVYAVIRGSAIASNGASKSLTMPCSETQKMVMRMAYQRFDIPMSSVQFVEAHGTGTPVGDPIEAKAIGEAFGSLNKRPIKIGSVKSNFGHTECASGVTSAIKVALMLEKKQLVPSINFNQINPAINLKRLNITVQTCKETIKSTDGPYRVGLNSFGFAGAVAHMIFEEAPKKEQDTIMGPTARWKFGEDERRTGQFIILPLSAKCPEALKDLATKWQNFCSELDALQIASWKATRHEHHVHRLVVTADSSDSFQNTLTSFLQDQVTDTMVVGEAAHLKPKICFVFPGQGQQWYNMGRHLYEEQSVFRDTINKCDNIFKRLSGWSLLEKTGIFNGDSIGKPSEDIVEEVNILQPAILFLQIGLFHLLKHWGIRPDVVVGNSLGEIAAAYAAAALSLKEAISVIYHRSVQQATLSGTGAMVAIRSDVETAKAICKSHPDVYVAVVNSPDGVTLGGDCNQIASIINNNQDKSKQLRVSAAYHTPYMTSIEAPFRKSMDGVITSDTRELSALFYSSVTGKLCKDPLDVDYWWQNIQRPVLFQEAVESVLHDTDVSIFLEIAATATLRSYIQKIANLNDPLRTVKVVTCGRRNANDQKYALLALGSLYTMGVDVNWKEVTQDAAQWAPIPTYPWQHQQSHWVEAEDHRKLRLGLDDRSFKGKNGYITMDTFSFLSEYFEDDMLVFPSTGIIEYASELVFGDRKSTFENVQFLKPLSWSSGANRRQTAIQLDMERVVNHIEITEKDTTYFTATVTETDVDNRDKKTEFDVDEVLERCLTTLSNDDFYHRLQVTGITRGSVLQVVDEVYLGESESLISLDFKSSTSKQQSFIAGLNAAFEASLVTVQQASIKYRPVSIGALTLQPNAFTDDEQTILIYTDVVDCDGNFLVSNVLILTESGSILGRIKNLECRNVDANTSTIDIEKCLFTTQWQPLDAYNIPTSSIPEMFEESQLKSICEDVDAIKRAEDMADNIENICVSYITHALEEVPEVERAQTKRYHKYMAIFDAVKTRYTKEVTPFDKIPEVMKKVLTHCPELEVEMRLCKRLGEALSDTLRNPHTCVPIMFSPECLDRYFWDGLSMKIYYQAAAETIVKSIREAFRTKQVVRVLELGARIGGMTRFIVEPLKEYGMTNRLEYVFTDVSATFFPQARQKLSEYPFIQYQVLNIEKGVGEQSYVPGSFDIVLCVDTLHVAVDARRSTGFMSDLLANNGLLYIIEGTNTHFLTELWFGTMDVCLVFEDERTQIFNKSCWFHREGWMQVMRDIGLKDVVSGSSANEFYHSVMIGRKATPDVLAPIRITESNEHSCTILIFEDTETPYHIHNKGNKRIGFNGIIALGEEMKHTLNGVVQIKPFSQIRRLANLLKRIDIPIEIIFVHKENNLDQMTLLELLQIAGTFPRKVSRLWVVVRTMKQLTPTSGAMLGLVQSLCNRTKSVPVYSLHVSSTCNSDEMVEKLLMLRSQNQLPEYHFFLSEGILQVPRITNYELYNTAIEGPKHWRVDCLKNEEATSPKFAFFDVHDIDIPQGYTKIQVRSIPLCRSDPRSFPSAKGPTNLSSLLSEIQCVGVVREITEEDGSKHDIRGGQEVLAFGQISLASHVVCDSRLVIQNSLDHQECYGLVPLITAYYSLHERARLDSSETVFISCDDVPLCLAAIKVAKYIGCQVICSARGRSEEKYLKEQIGMEKVIQVSSCPFKESVLTWTDKKGIDVVFLAASTPNLDQILSVMSYEGRLCDASMGSCLSMAGISSNLLMGNKVFHSCRTDSLLQTQPERFRNLVVEVIDLLEKKLLEPLPATECNIDEFLDGSIQIGENQPGPLVVHISEDFQPSDFQHTPAQFSSKATYIITAASTGLAQKLARWLYQNGARSIVLMSRNDLPTSAKQTQKFLNNHSVDVSYYKVKLEEEAEVKRVLKTIRSSSKYPIKGIFHLDTVIYDDTPFEIKAEEADNIISNFAERARNLHTLTKEDDLGIFLMLSSISTLVGIPSKPLTSAVGAYLNTLAEQRKSEGLPALSVQVGPIRCMGTVFGVSEAELYNMHYDTRQRSLHADDFLRGLGMLLRNTQQPVVCFGEQVRNGQPI